MREARTIDPELLPYAIDLARDELEVLTDRYFPPDALIVGGSSSTRALEAALLEKGFHLHSCKGPELAACPILHGEPCPLRESVDVAVVYIEGRRTWPGSGLLPRLICAANPASPAIVPLEGRGERAARHGRIVVLGDLNPVEEIAATAKRLAHEAVEPEAIQRGGTDEDN